MILQGMLWPEIQTHIFKHCQVIICILEGAEDDPIRIETFGNNKITNTIKLNFVVFE